MGSEDHRDREKDTLEISQSQFIRSVISRFNVSKFCPLPVLLPWTSGT